MFFFGVATFATFLIPFALIFCPVVSAATFDSSLIYLPILFLFKNNFFKESSRL
jgi:hypothetical protein